MNHRQLETFAAVMRAGTASRAADILGVTQPAVSRSLAELEKALGFQLFARVQNRLVPTPEAHQFFTEVEASFRGIDTLRAAAARIRDHGSGQLRIGSLSALGSSLVPRAIARFRQTHPDIAVTLIVAASREIRDQVASGAFDLGLAADEIDTTGVQHQLFVAPDAVCALPVGHRLAAKAVITPADLEGEPMIAYVPEDRARQRIDRIFDQAGIRPRIVVETIYAATVCALVSEGVGIGFVSRYGAAGHDQSRLVLRPFEPAAPIRSLLILPPDRPKSDLVRAMIDALMATR
ncbi:LysR family transcriptional regulator [Phreatobacter aquaticus]|uniref:LysR family transcriptional regulator n=1 Tax=Phreatobacter aquaticus TaxID=2570229 RepID=A0A4D7QH95_9HYPH|nr:LysR substrate-binding domain-containing protein [Phreatobacter aquaticus]QCK84757.1 LysR family transcriptional regulator [Phreatobacter aquaticus]